MLLTWYLISILHILLSLVHFLCRNHTSISSLYLCTINRDICSKLVLAFFLTKMASKNIIMIILVNICMKITSRWYIVSIMKMKKTIRIHRLSAIYGDVFCSNWITRKSQKDVSVQSVQINNCCCMKRRKKKDSCLYGGHKLFLSENWFEVVRVDCSVAIISPFGIDILPYSKSIWFDTKMTRIEPDDKVELREILRPLCLPLDQYLSSRKMVKIFMICNNINGISQTL